MVGKKKKEEWKEGREWRKEENRDKKGREERGRKGELEERVEKRYGRSKEKR